MGSGHYALPAGVEIIDGKFHVDPQIAITESQAHLPEYVRDLPESKPKWYF